MDSRFDDLLHTVIVEKGQGIYGFFDVVFGFMYKRTDFFYEMAPGENMGFFPGQAEAIVYNYFRKYQALHYKERVPKRNIDPKEVEEYLKKQKEMKDQKLNQNKLSEIKPEMVETKIENKENTEIKVPLEKVDEIKLTSKKIEEIKHKPDTTEVKSTGSLNPITQTKQENKNVDTSISTYNGDQCENYNWSQGVMDLTIQIKLPEGTNKRMLNVTMTNSHLKVLLKGETTPIIEGEFCEKIKADESNWSVEDNKSLILFLEKAQEVIWKSAFKGHKEIDTKKVDNSKRIDEFDNDTQAALNKIVYEQNRKKNGLLTTEEEKKMKALKDAWDAPDSPFKGQPFDPSMFNMNEPIYYNTPDYEAKLRAQNEKNEK